MAVDCRHLLNRLEEMAFEEQRAIRAEVDAAFFKPGWRSSPSLISASAVAIAAGLRRATARIADEAWAVAEKKDPAFTADAGKVAAHLRICMVGYYRQRLMSDRGGWSPEVTVKACRDLSETLRHICDKMVDQLASRSRPLPPALLPDVPSLAPAGRGAAGPEAPRREAAGSAPPAPTASGIVPLIAAPAPAAPLPAAPLPEAPVAAAAPIEVPLSEAPAISMPLAAASVLEAPVPATPVPATSVGAAPALVVLAAEAPGPLGAPEAPGPASCAGEAASPTPAGPTLVGPVETSRKRPPPGQSIDLARLSTLLAEVRNSLGEVWIDRVRRRALLREISAIEAFVQRENPNQSMLWSMVRRLPPALKMVRLDKAARSVENVMEPPLFRRELEGHPTTSLYCK
jgi:hypothetical protein